MKTFKSSAALKKAALARGASVSLGGLKFNSTADVVSVVEKPKPKEDAAPIPEKEAFIEPPKEPKAPEPPVDLAPIVQSAVDAMSASVRDIAEDSARVMKEVCKAVERLQAPVSAPASEPPPAPAKAWKLKVNRDTRGFMDTVDIVRVN